MAVRKRGGVSAVHIRTICAVQCTTGPVCCLPPGRRVAVAAAPPAERAWRGRERQRRATPPGDARWLWCTRVPGEWGVLPAVRARRQTCARRGQADVPVSPPPPPLRTALPTPLVALSSFFTGAGGGFAPSVPLWGQDAAAAHAAGAGCSRRCRYNPLKSPLCVALHMWLSVTVCWRWLHWPWQSSSTVLSVEALHSL
jgi:hypothetical protein